MLQKSRVPGWNWVLQRITALLLAVGLVGHFLVLHYTRLFNPESLSVPDSTGMRYMLATKFWLVFDGMLLAAGLYHALNGTYNIICDYNPSPRTRAVWSWAFWGLGLACFVLGIVLLGQWVAYARAEFLSQLFNMRS